MNRSILESLETARAYAARGAEAEAALHYRYAAGLLVLERVRAIARLVASRKAALA